MSIDVTPSVTHDNIIVLDRILEKRVKDITFKETISLIFHTVFILSHDKTSNSKYWDALYKEFQIQFNKQISEKWPQMIITKNYTHKCAYTILNEKSFIESNNLLTLLFRLLFIENHKFINVPSHYNFYKILNHELETKDDRIVKNLSLFEIFQILQDQLKYYAKVYKNKMHIEYQLVNSILKQIE